MLIVLFICPLFCVLPAGSIAVDSWGQEEQNFWWEGLVSPVLESQLHLPVTLNKLLRFPKCLYKGCNDSGRVSGLL